MYSLNFKDEQALLDFIKDNISYNFTLTVTKDNSGVYIADSSSDRVQELEEKILHLSQKIEDLEDALLDAEEELFDVRSRYEEDE